MEKIIIKYLNNTIKVEELKKLHTWLAESKENQNKFKSFVQANRDLDYYFKDINVIESFKKVYKATLEKERPTRKLYTRFIRYAAVGVLILGISFAIYFSLNENDNLKQSEVVYNEIEIPFGKKDTIYLSDNSVVIMNSGSKLKYPKTFDKLSQRDVYLDGEAYFDVKTNSLKPFVVHTNDVNIRVLGTKFNVSSFTNQGNTSVILEEGKVGIYKSSEKFKENKSITIAPGDQAEMKDGEIKVHKTSVENHLSWKEGKLYFDNETFENIIKEMERYYNVRITNHFKSINNVKYTGTYTSETVQEALSVLKEIQNDISIKVNGNHIELTSK